MGKLQDYYDMIEKQEKAKKQSKNKYNVGDSESLTRVYDGVTYKFDSGFEIQIYDNLARMQKHYSFEFSFHIPEESIHWWVFNKWNKRYEHVGLTRDDICNDKIHHLYEPDFIVKLPSGKKFYIESKGWFPPEDRTKMKTLKKLNPDLDVRLLFQKLQKLKGLKNGKTNVEWAKENNFITSAGAMLPKEWFKE